MSIFKDTDGKWKLKKQIKGAHPTYQKYMVRCLNSIEPAFCKAKKTSEFDFIQCLLRIRGYQDPGWDPFETLHDVFETFNIVKRKLKNDSQIAHIALFVYGLIIEASEPYETLANLLNVIEGNNFHLNNFPNTVDRNGKSRSQHPLTKIDQLKSRAKNNNLDFSFFDDIVDNKLRNAVFHSDYTIYWPELRASKRYTYEEWMTLINGVLAYYEAFYKIYQLYIKLYDDAKIIDVSATFSPGLPQKAVTIVRKKHGLIGIKHTWSEAEVNNGMIPWQLCRSLPYERKMIGEGRLILPPNRIKRTNKLLKCFPKFMRSRLVQFLERYSYLV